MAKKLSVEEFGKLSREAQVAHIKDSYQQIFEELGLGSAFVETGLAALLDAYLSSPRMEETVTLVVTKEEVAWILMSLRAHTHAPAPALQPFREWNEEEVLGVADLIAMLEEKSSEFKPAS